MCDICSAFRPFDPECPYTGELAAFAATERAEQAAAAERLRQIEALDLQIDDAEMLFGNAQPQLPFDPFEGIGFPENDPTGFGFIDIPSGQAPGRSLPPACG